MIAFEATRDAVRASGADATTFLQGQISQDIEALAPGEWAWSLVLEPQGKVDAWFRITRVDDNEYVLDIDAGHADALIARLERFKLRTDITFERLDQWRSVSVRGEGAASVDRSGAAIAATVRWGSLDGVDLLGPEVTVPDGAEVGDMDGYEAARVAAGAPAMGSELNDTVIPAEAGIVEQSVSFTKGCYVGQELVARIDSRGNNPPRRLRRVDLGGPAAVGDPIEVDTKVVGMLSSVARDGERWLALAYVGRAVDPPSTGLVDGVEATIL